MTFAEQVRREEQKRAACWSPRARWRAVQEAITWAESQPGVRRNTPAACLRAEARWRRAGFSGATPFPDAGRQKR